MANKQWKGASSIISKVKIKTTIHQLDLGLIKEMVFSWGNSGKGIWLDDGTEIMNCKMGFYPSPLPASPPFSVAILHTFLLCKKPSTGQGMSHCILNRGAQQINLCIGIWTCSWQISQSRWDHYLGRCVSALFKKRKPLLCHTDDEYF